MTQHLTDEHFADLLAGDPPDAGTELHLHACAGCRDELAALHAVAREFNALSLAWAQAEAPRRIVPPTRLQRLVSRGGPVLAFGLSAAMVAGMVITHTSGPGPRERQAASAVSAPSELSADNRLMQSIDQELQSRSELAVPVDELRGSEPGIAQPPAAAVAN